MQVSAFDGDLSSASSFEPVLRISAAPVFGLLASQTFKTWRLTGVRHRCRSFVRPFISVVSKPCLNLCQECCFSCIRSLCYRPLCCLRVCLWPTPLSSACTKCAKSRRRCLRCRARSFSHCPVRGCACVIEAASCLLCVCFLCSYVCAYVYLVTALRNTVPQSPPIGSLLDYSSFFWGRFPFYSGLILSLCLFVSVFPTSPFVLLERDNCASDRSFPAMIAAVINFVVVVFRYMDQAPPKQQPRQSASKASPAAPAERARCGGR